MREMQDSVCPGVKTEGIALMYGVAVATNEYLVAKFSGSDPPHPLSMRIERRRNLLACFIIQNFTIGARSVVAVLLGCRDCQGLSYTTADVQISMKRSSSK